MVGMQPRYTNTCSITTNTLILSEMSEMVHAGPRGRTCCSGEAPRQPGAPGSPARRDQSEHDRAVVVIRIDHVQLAMPAGREDEAAAFYEGLLGIPRVPKPAHLAVRGGCWFESADLKVHLGVEADFRAASKAHPAFEVSDLRALARTLAGAGCEVVEDEPLEGYDRVYVADPFGNRIELLQPLAPPDQ